MTNPTWLLRTVYNASFRQGPARAEASGLLYILEEICRDLSSLREYMLRLARFPGEGNPIPSRLVSPRPYQPHSREKFLPGSTIIQQLLTHHRRAHRALLLEGLPHSHFWS